MRARFTYFALTLLLAGLVVLLRCGSGSGSQPGPAPGPGPGPAPSGITITVNTGQQFQTFEAWRATAVGPNLLRNGVSAALPPAMLSQILDDLVIDLGLTGLRIEVIGSQNVEVVNDNSDPFVINPAGFDFAAPFQPGPNDAVVDPVAQMNQIVLPMKSRVESQGVPFSTYVSLIYDYSEFPAHWHNSEEYAEVAEAYHVWARNTFGFTPTYWVIVNEPNSAFFGASRELENDVVATGSRLRSRGFATKIQTIETAVPDSSDMQSVLSNATARQYVGLLSFHSYDFPSGTVPSFATRNAIRNLGQQYNLPTAMTEVCCKTGWGGSYEQALGWGRDIYWNLTEANASVWEPLAMMFACESLRCSSPGLDRENPISVDQDHSQYFKFPQYYALRQYAHHIRPGFRRVEVACPDCQSNATVGQNLKPVAFQGPAGQMVVVVLNDQSAAQDISLAGLPAGTYGITGLDPAHTSGITYSSQTITAGQALTFRMPASAIVTFAKP